MGLEHSRANCFLTSYLHFSTNLLLGLKDRKVLENKEKLPHECAPFYDRAYGANWYRQLRFDKTDWNTEEQDTCSNLCCLSYIADCEKEGSSVGCPSNDALLAMTYTAMERSKTRWEMPRTNNLIKFSFSYHRQLAVFDRRVHALLQLHSYANQLTVKQRKKSFDHRVGSPC